MKVVIFGTGAVGGYFGAHLQLAGADVTFIARGTNLEALQTTGLKIESESYESVRLPQVKATSNTNEVGLVDVIILCMKMWGLEEAAHACKPMIKSGHTVVITTQNGVEAPSIVGGILDQEHVVGGVVRIFTRLARPGVVVHVGPNHHLLYGPTAGPVPPALVAFHEVALKTAFHAQLLENINKDLWKKFAFLASLAGVGCLVRQPNGVLRSHPTTRQLMLDAAKEVLLVANAKGVDLGSPGPLLIEMSGFLERLPATSQPSMVSDLLAGQPVEAEWLSGAVVRIGARVGVATPVHAVIAAVMAPYANGPPTMPPTAAAAAWEK